MGITPTLQKRVRNVNHKTYTGGPIVYWMSRDQRIEDNWALIYAQEIALEYKQPLAIVHNLKASYLGGGMRQFDFKVRGLQEVEAQAKKKNIPFILFYGERAVRSMVQFLHTEKIGALITDFSPLNINRKWVNTVSRAMTIPFYEVDAHNIVPCWVASQKQEFAARTIRPKIHRLLPEFLKEYTRIKQHPHTWNTKIQPVDWGKIQRIHDVDKITTPVTWIQPGAKAAAATLRTFIQHKIAQYDVQRNDPNADGVSNISPYLHYGHISAQRVALEVEKHTPHGLAQEAYIEELVIRRELADNFCLYNIKYDSFEGFSEWARKTLNAHRKDKREYVYTQKQFEHAKTHDELWNAAQREMVITGKMHGYIRMYWAKKILEWSASPEDALKMAIFLNDRYELDGRDPNGYVGIAWSIGGVHDRPWFERSIFGTIRYMSINGIKKKFAIDQYIQKYIQ